MASQSTTEQPPPIPVIIDMRGEMGFGKDMREGIIPDIDGSPIGETGIQIPDTEE